VRRGLVLAGAAVLAAAVVAVIGLQLTAGGASPVTRDEIGDDVQTVARGRMPVFGDGRETRPLYQFATSRGDVLRYMPCSCGCAQFGHTSNRSCYIKAETESRVTYTSHAAT
jgi:hypothetical protein